MPSLQDLLGSFKPLFGTGSLHPGIVVSFHYSLYQHDPYPIIILLEERADKYLGINLHYLTFPVIHELFKTFGDVILYEQVKNLPNIRNSIRKYKKSAITQPRVQELSEIVRRLRIARMYPEHEIQQAREDFRQQAAGGSSTEGRVDQ